MKASSFEYRRPDAVAAVIAHLAEHEDAALLAGGQSLLPMMNFRVARPSVLIDLSAVTELRRVEVSGGIVRIGSMVTHAQLEDGLVPGAVGAFLANVAQGIAFRAIRNRGTIGGSVAQADPAADWPTALACLRATVALDGPNGPRELPMAGFILGPMETAIAPGEVITALTIPESAGDSFGWSKSMRKAGEFAEAIAAVRISNGLAECWIGALGAPAFRIDIPADTVAFAVDERLTGTVGFERLKTSIAEQAQDVSGYRIQLAAINACRALAQASCAGGAR